MNITPELMEALKHITPAIENIFEKYATMDVAAVIVTVRQHELAGMVLELRLTENTIPKELFEC